MYIYKKSKEEEKEKKLSRPFKDKIMSLIHKK